jgi:hypothetical protein
MSGNDPFFDAWVRDKLLHTEAPTPEHLWDRIRKGSRTYVIMERNKYFLILLLLLGATAGTGYWAFHSGMGKAPNGLIQAKKQRINLPVLPAASQQFPATGLQTGTGVLAENGAGPPGIPASGLTASDMTTSGLTTSGLTASGMTASGMTTSGMTATASGLTASDMTTSGLTASGIIESDLTGITLNKTAMNSNLDGLDDIRGMSAFPRALRLPATRPDPGISAVELVHVNNPRHTYFEIYAGPDHVEHYITTSNKAFDTYIAQKRSVESSYPSFSVGLRLDMPLAGNDWRLQLGLHYAQINEKMDYSNFNTVKTVTEVSSRYQVQTNGSSVLVRDTSMVSVKGQFVKQSLNAYRMIDIPVMVSRTLFKTGQVQVNGSGGAMFNVTSWYNGDILDTNNLPVAIQTKTAQGASAWKKHIGTSLYGSLSLYDQVFKRVQATFEPYLRYDLSPVNKDVSIYRERFVTTGLMVGVRYQLGK